MGTIAAPNTPYCSGLQQASLSVGGQTFSTQNPPISYVVENNQATIYDANGVIGIVSLMSDQLKEVSRSPASPNTNYCSSIKAKLTWNGGEIETENPPINYQLLPSNVVTWGSGGTTQGSYSAPKDVGSATISNNANKLIINGETQIFPKPVASWQNIPQSQIRIDWGGGDVEFINGTTWGITKPAQDVPYHRFAAVADVYSSDGSYLFQTGTFRFNSTTTNPNAYILMCAGNPPAIAASVRGFYAHTTSVELICGSEIRQYSTSPSPPNVNSLGQDFLIRLWIQLPSQPQKYRYEVRLWMEAFNVGLYRNVIKTVITSNTGAISERWGDLNPAITSVTTSCTLRITFTDGTTEDLSYPLCPTVSAISGCSIDIIYADSSTESIAVDPCPEWVEVSQNKLKVYDETGLILEQNYQSPPSNFQAICYGYDIKEVSYSCKGECPSGTEFQCKCGNTLMCYGFDPNNPNLFSPLFTTEITT